MHKMKLKSRLNEALPKSEDEIGKHIEQKLTASQKVWSNVGVAVFSENALENLSHFSTYMLGALMLILTDIVMIFPTDKKSLIFGNLVSNFIFVLIGLVIINLISFGMIRALGGKTPFKVFFSTVNTTLFMSLLVVSIPIALISFALFSTMLKSSSAITLFFSIIPFYNYLVYGWASETIAKMKGVKSIAVALVSLLAVLALNLILPSIIA